MAQAESGAPLSVAFLGVHLANDNQALEPTSEAETTRVHAIEDAFRAKLGASGQFKVLPVPSLINDKIAAGAEPGACNGCELAYAKDIGGEAVAWITVQKVSNLILNMNLYMGDVETGKLTFVHSVDIRGNTDESWSRSLDYLLDNYLFAPPATQ